ncbi:uncharacterized protein LOC115358857 isoform X2 [Myripristis murdjan]|uniref:Uncharacterized LOC115358857 n=1 Tax=Myripristis murdjan TaxID=586833 RepID=A0A668AXP1_9TELE|nr:uncharacterized protein LOC115358857 isoform X2 [Myripristis murdjan]
MEEAYMELYREFLRLRSLCLRQAALLQQLTKALQKQQGSGTFLPNGELSDMVSIPVQCSQDGPARLLEDPGPLVSTAQNATAQHGIDHLSRGAAPFSDLLAEDMSKLCVDEPCQRKEDRKTEHKEPPVFALDFPGWHKASSSESKPPRQAGLYVGDRMPQTFMVGRPFLDNDCLNQAGGMLMSGLVLDSHVCEFCQAVFPDNATTRGEFLRHLHSHIT